MQTIKFGESNCIQVFGKRDNKRRKTGHRNKEKQKKVYIGKNEIDINTKPGVYNLIALQTIHIY